MDGLHRALTRLLDRARTARRAQRRARAPPRSGRWKTTSARPRRSTRTEVGRDARACAGAVAPHRGGGGEPPDTGRHLPGRAVAAGLASARSIGLSSWTTTRPAAAARRRGRGLGRDGDLPAHRRESRLCRRRERGRPRRAGRRRRRRAAGEQRRRAGAELPRRISKRRCSNSRGRRGHRRAVDAGPHRPRRRGVGGHRLRHAAPAACASATRAGRAWRGGYVVRRARRGQRLRAAGDARGLGARRACSTSAISSASRTSISVCARAPSGCARSSRAARVAYHQGGGSLAPASPRRFYFAARNHLLLAHDHRAGGPLAARRRVRFTCRR